MSDAGGYDLFLSHGSPDKGWVRELKRELKTLGLRSFLDEEDLEPGRNFVIELSDALLGSRFLVLILTRDTPTRPWIEQEWTTYLHKFRPTGRIIPVELEPVELPGFLGPIQKLSAQDRDAKRVARKLAQLVGLPGKMKQGDSRRVPIGHEFIVGLKQSGDTIAVEGSDGRTREVEAPWANNNRFASALHEFQMSTRKAVDTAADRAELFTHAGTLGEALFGLLFDADDGERLNRAIAAGGPRPVILVRSNDDDLQSLPWELIRFEGTYLVRDHRVDLVRTSAGDEDAPTLPSQPSGPFKLVINVSAPEGSMISYEEESYRLAKALAELCPQTPTELGTLRDLVDTVARVQPTGVHFSGQAAPGTLSFEDVEGRADVVKVEQLLKRLRDALPDGKLPPFFYLATCHGNDSSGSESLAARLHREGAMQVVGYSGPILDHLSTRAEEALYAAIAEGHPTRFAVHCARSALNEPPADGSEITRQTSGPAGVGDPERETHPFAWSQLVLYQRGPDHPLSQPAPAGWRRNPANVLQRTYRDAANRRVLATGFIGRRTDLHRIRKRLRRGDRVFVLQGLGGLGKSTLAFYTLPLIAPRESQCVLWCQDAERHHEGTEPIATNLAAQLSEFGRQRFGLDWESIGHHVDRATGDDTARRFECFLQAIVARIPFLVVYLDNLESLLVGPETPDPNAFGAWRSPVLEAIWATLTAFAENTDRLFVVASCRYIHDDFGAALIPVNVLPDDAVFRLTEWFPALRRLHASSRRHLVARLEGHPRAVEFVDDLIADALNRHAFRYSAWRLPAHPNPEDLAKEWSQLVAPALPRVEQKLRDDLLFDKLWSNVLDDDARRMLYRMTLLRRPWTWDLMRVLGDPDAPLATADGTAERLRGTSLLEQVDLWSRTGKDDEPALVTHFTLHPATAQFIHQSFGDDQALRLSTHLRVGAALEERARFSPYIETDIEAGHHLFQAGAYDRSCELLGAASAWLQDRGRVREGLVVLVPFLAEEVRRAMRPVVVGRLLGTIGIGYALLGQAEKAVGYYEQRLAIARDVGDCRGEGMALGNLGLAYATLGQTEKAIGYHERNLVIAREAGDRRSEGAALGNLGNAYRNLGQAEKAFGYYEQHLAIVRELGDRRGEGMALGNLGNAYADLGQTEKAVGYYEQRLAIAREVGDRRGEGQTLGNLGNAYADLGQAEKAIGYHTQYLAITRATLDRRGEGRALGSLGIVYKNLRQTEKAIGLLEQALRIAQEVKDLRVVQFVTDHLDRLQSS